MTVGEFAEWCEFFTMEHEELEAIKGKTGKGKDLPAAGKASAKKPKR